MLSRGHADRLMTEPVGTDPLRCDEYGYGLGRLDGILVLKYQSAGRIDFPESRVDFLHQFYWSPGGTLSTRSGTDARFVGPGEAFWAHRAVTHEVGTAGRHPVYRVCLRQVPAALEGLRAGAVSIDDEAARLVEAIARPGCGEPEALAARERILSGLGALGREAVGRRARGSGFARTVARTLSHDPGDRTELAEWAGRLHISVKTLQRDFEREFGMPYSQWRARFRLAAARVLLETRPVGEVAHRVGYASTSAFIAAFSKEFGCTPGRAREPRHQMWCCLGVIDPQVVTSAAGVVPILDSARREPLRMLSDREREELAAIEQRLTAGDGRLAAAFRSGAPPAERRWPIRALLGFGAFLLVIALLTGADGLFLQGLLCLGAGFGWRHWRTVRARDAGGSTAAGPPRGARPDGTPPGWFRSV